jgi:hypothetical protein
MDPSLKSLNFLLLYLFFKKIPGQIELAQSVNYMKGHNSYENFSLYKALRKKENLKQVSYFIRQLTITIKNISHN